jgi:hypothetical protein
MVNPMQQRAKVSPAPSRSRLVLSIIILLVLAVVLIFSLPIIQIPVRVTETYFETEYKEEPYTEIETYSEEATSGSTGGNSQIIFEDALISLGAPIIPDRWGTEIAFNLDIEGKTNVIVRGNWKVENFSHAIYATITNPRYHIVYQYRGATATSQEDSIEFPANIPGIYIFRLSSDHVRLAKYGRLTLAMEWGGTSEQATEQVKTREVTKYREVPVKVEKERTVTQYSKGSVWEALFGGED